MAYVMLRSHSAQIAEPINVPLETLLGYQLRRASALMVADLSATLEDLALKPAEASILLLIGANPGITQSRIGRALAIKRANMAPIAAMLTRRRLIERSQPDGRAQGLELSTEGLATAQDVRVRIERHEARFLPDLSGKEREEFIAILRRIWA